MCGPEIGTHIKPVIPMVQWWDGLWRQENLWALMGQLAWYTQWQMAKSSCLIQGGSWGPTSGRPASEAVLWPLYVHHGTCVPTITHSNVQDSTYACTHTHTQRHTHTIHKIMYMQIFKNEDDNSSIYSGMLFVNGVKIKYAQPIQQYLAHTWQLLILQLDNAFSESVCQEYKWCHTPCLS